MVLQIASITLTLSQLEPKYIYSHPDPLPYARRGS